MTKRKLGSHSGQEVIRTHTCAHSHVQKEPEQKIKREKTQQTERGRAQKEGMGWTDRKVNRGEGNKRIWKKERLGNRVRKKRRFGQTISALRK